MRIVVSGGGTGGHIYPALAIARYAQTTMNAQVLYIGTTRGLERELVPRTGVDCRFIEVEGLRRKLSVRAFKTAWLAMTATFSARKELKAFRPDVVVGTGGYVVAPVILAAYSLGIPSAIMEMDAKAGLANRMVSRFADLVMLAMSAGASSFPHAKHLVVTGNPRATEAVSGLKEHNGNIRGELKLNHLPIITIVSGSRGAKPINQAVQDWLQKANLKDFQVVWITGEVHFEAIQSELQLTENQQTNVRLLSYYHDMPALLSISTLLISRAGATILSELTALGIPAILIPSPYVTHRHQDHNAQALVNEGAALLLPEEELHSDRLRQEVEAMIHNPFRLEMMKKSSKKLGRPDALNSIAAELIKLTNKS
jgi:UDP-N-acetylglucosamine--N-acetylmuramyl-(pentapeptide) pyrophosphoryl-undecaprenol N-acetylglucosamine transferase